MATWSSQIRPSISHIHWCSPLRTGRINGIPPSWASSSANAVWAAYIHPILTSARLASTSGELDYEHLLASVMCCSLAFKITIIVRFFCHLHNLNHFRLYKHIHKHRHTHSHIQLQFFSPSCTHCAPCLQWSSSISACTLCACISSRIHVCTFASLLLFLTSYCHLLP